MSEKTYDGTKVLGVAMKLVYVAGPFTGPDRATVDYNISRAEQLGIEVAKLGAFPVIPHCNTSHPEFERVQGYEFWIEGTKELMIRTADALILVDGYERSSGARGEVETMREMGRPVFETLEDLKNWLERERAE